MAQRLDQLDTFDDDGGVRVVVEASAGTRSKFKYDPQLAVFELHHVIPPGTAFPLDFGFLPRTIGDDGDPLDVLVFADEPSPVGAVIHARLVGVIEAKQKKKKKGGKPARNDRFLAVAKASYAYAAWKDMNDVPQKMLEAIEAFFVTYNAQRGVIFEPVGRHGASAAAKLLRQGQRRIKE
jgi:inorganic pyrophosphatase